jgi:type IV secretory pathway TrbL component
MDANMIDTITNAFVSALQGGLSTLSTYSIPLLGAFSLIAFSTQMWPLLCSGSGAVADSLAATLLSMVKFGLFFWMLVNLAEMTNAALETFFLWGMAPSATALSLDTYKQPSIIIDLGFQVAKPLIDFHSSFLQRLVPAYALTLWGYSLAYWVVIFSFFAVALHLMMVLIEYYMAVMVAAVLIPWGVMSVAAFFTEFSIGWFTGGLVRMLVTTAMTGIARPLFDDVFVKTTPGGDPTFYGAAVVGLASIMFAILSWVVPGRAAHIAGRGVSLALHAGTVLATAAGPGRGVLMVTSAIRGVSQMMRRA